VRRRCRRRVGAPRRGRCCPASSRRWDPRGRCDRDCSPQGAELCRRRRGAPPAPQERLSGTAAGRLSLRPGHLLGGCKHARLRAVAGVRSGRLAAWIQSLSGLREEQAFRRRRGDPLRRSKFLADRVSARGQHDEVATLANSLSAESVGVAAARSDRPRPRPARSPCPFSSALTLRGRLGAGAVCSGCGWGHQRVGEPGDRVARLA